MHPPATPTPRVATRPRFRRRHSCKRRATITLVTVASVVAGLLTSIPGTSRAAAAPAPARPLSEASASAQAQDTGQPVEVTSETSETEQVMANPDGTFALTSTREPIRVQRAGAWVPVDPTLHANPDGSLSPVATAENVTFSGGGTTPLVRLADGQDSIAFSWPAALPTPTVSGDTATYPSVLPGVDLAVTARADSYTTVLVVHDAAAAANPAVAQIHLAATATGLNLATDAGGGLSATDQDGVEVFHGSAPIMWDSTLDPEVGPTPTVKSTGSGQVSRLGLSMPTADGTPGTGTTQVTLIPPSQSLTGPDVDYPLFIDPGMTGTRQHFAVVFNNGWHYYDNTSLDLKVGACPQARSDCGNPYIGTGRSYFSLDTSPLTGRATTAHIYSADLQVLETHNSAACTAEPVRLFSAGAISSSTVWAGPASTELQTISSNRSDTCASAPPAWLHFENANVVARAQAAANNDAETLTFALIADDESNIDQWKRFAATGADTVPRITITYDFPPSVPTGLGLAQKVQCNGKPIYTRETNPRPFAQAHDNNPSPGNVGLWFEVFTSGGTRMRYNPAAVSAPPDTRTVWHTGGSNSNNVAPLYNDTYDLRVRASSLSPDTADQYSAWSAGHYYFTLDHSAPDAPTISSFDYPPNAWGAPKGTPGQFTVASDGAAAFTYSFDGGDVALPDDTDCDYNHPSKNWIPASSGTATIPVPNDASFTPGPHTLYVRSFDDAHNVSAESTGYTFYMPPTFAGAGATKLEAETLATSPTTPLTQPDGQSNYTFVTNTSVPMSNGNREQMVGTGGTPDQPQKFTFTLTPNITADYALGVQVLIANHCAKLGFELDHQPIRVNGAPVTIDTYSPTADERYVQLGGAHFTAGEPHTITIDLIGTNPASGDYIYNGTYGGVPITNVHDNGYTAGIDFFNAIPINNVSASTFANAMNNRGIAIDGTTPANIGPSNNGRALSQQALQQATTPAGQTVDLSPGSSPTIDGITFTLPARNPDGTDNVMADGQTIPLPAAVLANNVDLLATSTCGGTSTDLNLAKNIRLSINYADDNVRSDQLPSVPDWTGPPPPVGPPPPAGTSAITLAATTAYVDTNTAAKDTTAQGRIYHLSLPNLRTGSPIKSVTLPYLGSTFTNECTTPTLHIFAIATS